MEEKDRTPHNNLPLRNGTRSRLIFSLPRVIAQRSRGKKKISARGLLEKIRVSE